MEEEGWGRRRTGRQRFEKVRSQPVPLVGSLDDDDRWEVLAVVDE